MVKYAVQNVLSGEILSYWYSDREYAVKAVAMFQKRFYNALKLEIVSREVGEN